ncbi:hypothetical protein B296_00055179, partial [Ensete ventricosum]
SVSFFTRGVAVDSEVERQELEDEETTECKGERDTIISNSPRVSRPSKGSAGIALPIPSITGGWNDLCRDISSRRSDHRRMERFKWIPQSLHGGDQDRDEDLLGEFEGSDSWSPLQVLHLLCRFGCLIANLSFVSDSLLLPLGQRLYGFAASLVIGIAFMLLVRCFDS